MKIQLTEQVDAELNAALMYTRREFSGYGWIEIVGDTFLVKRVVFLAAGSEAFTEIPASKTLELMKDPEAAKMKLWFHRHPMGNGIPGPHNWSGGTSKDPHEGCDEFTARCMPLGGIPELVRWSISMVYTLGGWVGRYDTYGEGGKTFHIQVESPTVHVHKKINELLADYNFRHRKLDVKPCIADADEAVARYGYIFDRKQVEKAIAQEDFKRFRRKERGQIKQIYDEDRQIWEMLIEMEEYGFIEPDDFLELWVEGADYIEDLYISFGLEQAYEV